MYVTLVQFAIHLLHSFYIQNLNQNPRTLLPKFYGLYCYQVSSDIFALTCFVQELMFGREFVC